MKVHFIIALASALIFQASAFAADNTPSSDQMNRYYAALSGLPSEANDRKAKRNIDSFDSDLEMLEALRSAYPTLSPEELISRFFELRLGAIVDSARES